MCDCKSSPKSERTALDEKKEMPPPQSEQPMRSRKRKRERKPGTGNSYSKFVKAQMQTAEIKKLPYKSRFGAIGKKWKARKSTIK